MNVIDLSSDGRWLAVRDGQLWLEDGADHAQRAVPAPSQAPFALERSRLWTVRDERLGYFDLERGDRWIEIEPCTGALTLQATPMAVVVIGADRVDLVRERMPTIRLDTRGAVRGWITGDRWLLVRDASGAGWVDLASAAPAVARAGLSAPVIDATSLVDGGCALLLLDRGDHQELAIVRRPAFVLRRIRVRGVVGIRGAAHGFRAVLLTDDGRSVVCDLRGRDVQHVIAATGDHRDARISADGSRVVAASRGARGLQLFDSGAPAFCDARAA